MNQGSGVGGRRPGAGGYGARVIRQILRFKWLVLFTSILLLALVFLGWQFWEGSDDDTLAEIQRRGTLRIGLDASFPPFEMMDENGRIMGLDVDISRAIAADLGVEAEFVNIGFDGLYDALLARRVDIIISGLPYDPRWTQDVAYSRNYFNAGQMLVTRVGAESINTVQDLAGRTVAIEWGSQADMEGRQLAAEIEDLTLLRRESAAEVLEAVFNGQADAAIVDAVSGASAFPQGLKIITYLSNDWYVAAVHIKSQALLAAVDQSLLRLEESGNMARMQAEWLHGR
ncbi:MAG: amino acid ABC transporter substrate-binding protein [Anaerolineae bacterium]|nr:amino acid ABC transporter substrate-binding protein [Anaerolineae bacterium]